MNSEQHPEDPLTASLQRHPNRHNHHDHHTHNANRYNVEVY